jgi:hypothetical protein
MPPIGAADVAGHAAIALPLQLQLQLPLQLLLGLGLGKTGRCGMCARTWVQARLHARDAICGVVGSCARPRTRACESARSFLCGGRASAAWASASSGGLLLPVRRATSRGSGAAPPRCLQCGVPPLGACACVQRKGLLPFLAHQLVAGWRTAGPPACPPRPPPQRAPVTQRPCVFGAARRGQRGQHGARAFRVTVPRVRAAFCACAPHW